MVQKCKIDALFAFQSDRPITQLDRHTAWLYSGDHLITAANSPNSIDTEPRTRPTPSLCRALTLEQPNNGI
jgi:hypothetical protein